MDKIRIKNVRSLKDTKEITLSPITLLVGENSSGKSTFLRLFPLIKQSISKRTDGPLLWAGDVDDYVDFGSFDEAVTNDGSNDMTFCFFFEINNSCALYSSDVTGSLSELAYDVCPKNQVRYSISIAQKNAHEYISKLNIQINHSKFDFDLSPIPFTGKIIVDGSSEYPISKTSEVFRHFHYRATRASSSVFGYALPDLSPIIERTLQKFVRIEPEYVADAEYVFEEGRGYRIMNNRHPYETDVLQSIGHLLCSDISWKKIKEAVKSSKTRDDYWENVILCLDKADTGEREDIFAVCKLVYFYEYFSRMDRYLESYFTQVHYIAPLRATAERYYRLRNLAIDEVDYQGKNLAIFLSGLSKKRIQEFQQWTKEYFGFFVTVAKSVGHLSVKISLNDEEDSINMSDTGFGYSQILPIITQIWDLSTSQQLHYSRRETVPLVIAIEQPELHLHPALQAKLVKVFIASIKLAESNGYRLQLLIETHSETIVNYLGRAIAAEKLSKEDISVILFDKNIKTRRTTVRTSNYDSDGYLTNWPIGFFSPKEW